MLPASVPQLVVAQNDANSLIWWTWIFGGRSASGAPIRSHLSQIGQDLLDHVNLTLASVALGLLISIPLAVLARRYRLAAAPILSVTGIIYTIPSIALFFLLGPFTGYTTKRTAIIALTAYTLQILVRNIVVGLQSVPPDVVDAARGMGYRPLRLLLTVEVPLALPGILAGVRIATVSTIGLVTIASLIGQGGLGVLIETGLNQHFQTPLMVGSILSIALAVVADGLLVLVQRFSTPWVRARASR